MPRCLLTFTFLPELLIEKADLAIGNLETVTAGETSGYTSFPRFNTPDSIIDALAYAGFDVIVTANNHSLDRGSTGIVRTIEQINKRNLLTTGTYIKPGKNYLTVELGGADVSILAYTQHLNGNLPLLSEDEYFMVNQMDKETLLNDVRYAAVHSDLVILYLHWGNEYTRNTEPWQRDYAIELFNAGADVILGTHPHVVRSDEVFLINGEYKYVIYSMGNFISNFKRTSSRKNALYTEDGVMVMLNFNINYEGVVELTSVEPIPTWPYKYINETGIHYEIIPVPDLISNLHESTYAESEARYSHKRTMESLTGFMR